MAEGAENFKRVLKLPPLSGGEKAFLCVVTRERPSVLQYKNFSEQIHRKISIEILRKSEYNRPIFFQIERNHSQKERKTMITYICRNRDEKTGADFPCTGLRCETSVCPTCGGRAEAVPVVYWCESCRIPLYEERCALCGEKARPMTADVRPVFPEERLLVEILAGEPFCFREASVWNGSGNHYYVDGKRIPFSVGDLKKVDADAVRAAYEALRPENDSRAFDETAGRFVRANGERFARMTEEAGDYIRTAARDYGITDLFVSFSGGKDSTVTSDLVMRALSSPRVMHIFGDTTLEFPFTYEYVERFKKEHPRTPLLPARNREKDFEELCEQLGPPSRVMRWCCTVFKTGVIQKKIRSLYRDKSRILTFYGIRRGESSNRSRYERETDSPKITKQRIASPIIDWMDFDVWLYLLTRGIDFNDAYRLGYARVGCWCCPNNSGWSEFLSRVHLPERSARFRRLLISFAERIGKEDAEEYVDGGFWKARQGGNGVDYAKKSVISFQPCAAEENTFHYELLRPVSEALYELFRPFGYLNFEMGRERLGEVYVLDKAGGILLKLQGRIGGHTFKVTIVNHRIAGAYDQKTAGERVLAQITKYQMCMGCLACESVCRFNALSVKEGADGVAEYRIADEKCTRCGECVSHFTGGCYLRKVLTIRRT